MSKLAEYLRLFGLLLLYAALVQPLFDDELEYLTSLWLLPFAATALAGSWWAERKAHVRDKVTDGA